MCTNTLYYKQCTTNVPNRYVCAGFHVCNKQKGDYIKTKATTQKKRLETRFLRCYNDVGPSPTKDLWGIIAMSDPVRQWTAKG
ncbi:UNVERIFIED_CONTAM: hypothetical protein FKN15_038453 [Acipenser sinensis]